MKMAKSQTNYFADSEKFKENLLLHTEKQIKISEANEKFRKNYQITLSKQ